MNSKDFYVIVLLNSTHLDIKGSNATSQLYQSREELRLRFYSAMNLDDSLKGTPLDNKRVLRKIRQSKNWIHHISDSIRLASIYKLGNYDTLCFPKFCAH